MIKRTQLAFIGMRLLGTPFWCLISMLTFILYKNLHLTPIQVATIVALKPATSFLSPYWSSAIHGRPDKIIANLVGANFFRYLPFLLTPWINSPWLLIFAFGLYMLFSRATIPAWMELLKYNLPQEKRGQLVSYGTIVDYLGAALLAIFIGSVLDHYPDSWRWLFSLTAGFGILSTLLLACISHNLSFGLSSSEPTPLFLRQKIFQPWKEMWSLLRYRKDFTIFQMGFMLGGAGLMIIQPALPQFFVDTLHLSFVEMGLAISLCKGLGVACTSPLWAKLFRKLTIFHFSALVTVFAALFPFLLLATSWSWVLLYIAYSFYGIMQAGSELSWHMSGLIFARDKDSTTFSSTNILAVGLRGCTIPAIGAFFLPYLHPIGLMLFGATLSLSASCYFLTNGKSLKNQGASPDFSQIFGENRHNGD